jgi:hypothetical protein
LRIWVAVVGLVVVACAKPAAERITWSKDGDTPVAREHAEAECANAASVERVTVPYAGVGAGPPRSVDLAGRGREGYIACMESKGYTLVR